jgi:hypothetical protein
MVGRAMFVDTPASTTAAAQDALELGGVEAADAVLALANDVARLGPELRHDVGPRLSLPQFAALADVGEQHTAHREISRVGRRDKRRMDHGKPCLTENVGQRRDLR